MLTIIRYSVSRAKVSADLTNDKAITVSIMITTMIIRSGTEQGCELFASYDRWDV
jgi:hypothetical protein